MLHEMHRIDRTVTPYLPGGAMGTTRREASWRPAALAPELTQLIETSMQWAHHCQTAFDPQAADRSTQAGLQLDLRACAPGACDRPLHGLAARAQCAASRGGVRHRPGRDRTGSRNNPLALKSLPVAGFGTGVATLDAGEPR